MSQLVSLSEAVSIALHSMAMIARNGGRINVNEIAESISVSKNHLSKVMQRLAKDNLVFSNRGPNGGFVLAKKPEEITLLEIYESIEGPLKNYECILHKPVCPFEHCIFKNSLEKIKTEFTDYLKQNTLKSILEEEHKDKS